MNIQWARLDAYFDKLKKESKKVPCHAERARPNLLKISAGSGVSHRYLTAPENRRRINLAVEELGLDVKRGTSQVRLKKQAEQNLGLVDEYLLWLEERGLTLPENPRRRGEVFFEQLKVELGFAPNALSARAGKPINDVSDALVKMIESAVPRLGLGVRVLAYSIGFQDSAFTYKHLYEKGTEEPKRELVGKPNAPQQLSNTRWALKLFCKASALDLTEAVGNEFLADFEKSVDGVLAQIKNFRTRRKFNTEIRRWFDYYQILVKEACLPEDFHQCFARLVDMSALPITVLAKLIETHPDTVKGWYKGRMTPRPQNLAAMSRMEALCKLPTGSLVSKVSRHEQSGRILYSQLPDFLRPNRALASRICRHI